MRKDNKFIQLAAVQYKLTLNDFTRSENFKAKINAIMADIKNRVDPNYNTMVVFPEDIGTMLVLDGMGELIKNSQTLNEGMEKSIKQNIITLGLRKILNRTSWSRTLFLSKSQGVAKTYFDTFSAAAKTYGMYIVAGSVLLPDYEIKDGKCRVSGFGGNKIYNISYLFGPDGFIIGRQKKVYLIELEGPEGLDIEPAELSELKVYDTPIGKIGIAICFDGFKEDVLDELKKQGADILVQPSANPGPWTHEQKVDWLNGSWRAAASKKMFDYAVNPMMTGGILDVRFFGQSSVVAAKVPTPESNYVGLDHTHGFVSLSERFDDEELVIAKVPRP